MRPLGFFLKTTSQLLIFAVIAVGRDYNEKHSQAETINQFEKVEDVYLGGSSSK